MTKEIQTLRARYLVMNDRLRADEETLDGLLEHKYEHGHSDLLQQQITFQQDVINGRARLMADLSAQIESLEDKLCVDLK